MNRGQEIPETVTIQVPLCILNRGGRKEIQLPERATQQRRADSTLVKALVRAFRWGQMLGSGQFASSPNWPSGKRPRYPT